MKKLFLSLVLLLLFVGSASAFEPKRFAQPLCPDLQVVTTVQMMGSMQMPMMGSMQMAVVHFIEGNMETYKAAMMSMSPRAIARYQYRGQRYEAQLAFTPATPGSPGKVALETTVPCNGSEKRFQLDVARWDME